MNRKYRGESNPPVSGSVLQLMVENAPVSAVLDPLLQDLVTGREHVSVGGVSYAEMLQLLRYDPGAYRRWPSTAPEERCFDSLCGHVGRAAAVRLILRAAARGGDHDGKLARVVVKPKDRDAENPVQARNRDNAQARSDSVREARLEAGRRIQEIAEAGGLSDNAAISLYRERVEAGEYGEKREVPGRTKCQDDLALYRRSLGRPA
jgi:hypothetical protein